MRRTAVLTKEGPMRDVTNGDRADWASSAVQVFAVKTGVDQEDVYIQVKDLLTDLLHFCDREGIVFKDVVRAAKGMYEEEKATDPT